MTEFVTIPTASLPNYFWALLLLPLFSFALLYVLGRNGNRLGPVLGTGLMLLGLALSIPVSITAFGLSDAQHLLATRFDWFNVGETTFHISASLGQFAGILLLIVYLVSLLVHLFSLAYMAHDPARYRYFAFLGLFTASMLGIVLFDNLLLIFISWELVGLSSYLLIGFWWRKASAAAAAKKAFVVNRIGDAGFLLGLMILYAQFQTLELSELQDLLNDTFVRNGRWVFEGAELASSLPLWCITVAGIGLFCGAVGKSAQFPLQIWLPDAMEGPTPVSALIHAATMVAAGVYLLSRVFFLLDVPALELIAWTGALTALMGAVAAMRQFDIKKVLAYSTISQLGYMVMGIGVGGREAALLHLSTHALFKAALFLGAGAVIHTMHQLEQDSDSPFDAQDMRNMGGLARHMPKTTIAYFLASAALIGLPLSSGFLSKDAILSHSLAWASQQGGIGWLLPLLAFGTVGLTAWYVGRQLLLVFAGRFRLSAKAAPKEVPALMWLPVMLLGLGSLFIWFSTNPLDASSGWFMAGLQVPEIPLIEGYEAKLAQSAFNELAKEAHGLHLPALGLSLLLALGGLGLAWARYRPVAVKQALDAEEKASWWRGLSLHNWYLDQLYTKAVIEPVLWLAASCQQIDTRLIDGIIHRVAKLTVVFAMITAWLDRALVDGLVNGLARLAAAIGHYTKKLQGGNIQGYFVWSVLCLVALILIVWSWTS